MCATWFGSMFHVHSFFHCISPPHCAGRDVVADIGRTSAAEQAAGSKQPEKHEGFSEAEAAACTATAADCAAGAATFTGAAAVATESRAVLVEEGMVENSARLGEMFLTALMDLNSPHVKEIRGRGLWIGVELHEEAGGARRFCEELQARGLLCKETHQHVIRIAPPLVITEAEVQWALDHIAAVLGSPVEATG